MKKVVKSTYDEFVENKRQKKLLDAEYRKMLISELILASMEKDELSVRKLAAAAGVSPTIVQALKSGKKANINLGTLSKILDVIGYSIILVPKSGSGKKLKIV